LEGIFYILRTGIQWKAPPKEYGAASSIHQCFSEWAQAGFFVKMWQEGLLAGLGWEWQSVDGSMVKAPLGQEAVGPNPTDRGKKGTKRSVAAGSHGLLVGIVLDGANRHDIRLLEETPRSIITVHPEVMNMCLDAGYVGAQKPVEGMGYKAAHPGSWGRERGAGA
jgi:putative transposase